MDEAKPFKIPKREVWEAFKRVKANRGAAGVDGQSIAEFEANLSGNLYKLWNRLSSGSYFPPPVLRVEIPKANGSMRPLGIPTVADRVAQEVARRYLEPILEPVFHANSYGYRPGDYLKGRHWRLFARECSLNPKQVLDRVSTLAKLTAAETRAAKSEVAAMPAGPHPIHSQTRQAIERRAQVLLAQLHEAGDEPDIERVEDCIPASAGEKSGGVSRDISRGSETFAIDRTIA